MKIYFKVTLALPDYQKTGGNRTACGSTSASLDRQCGQEIVSRLGGQLT